MKPCSLVNFLPVLGELGLKDRFLDVGGCKIEVNLGRRGQFLLFFLDLLGLSLNSIYDEVLFFGLGISVFPLDVAISQTIRHNR